MKEIYMLMGDMEAKRWNSPSPEYRGAVGYGDGKVEKQNGRMVAIVVADNLTAKEVDHRAYPLADAGLIETMDRDNSELVIFTN
ncbi:hypothetical protein A2U01_0034560 [Trifolium medium]|uniref:Uncharacterized protein n=1 Tax=Trifolium medium TaxID=97028 RepID=A0A392PMX1_9FABA|nr:hypothetical protein [Trifolium medium]